MGDIEQAVARHYAHGDLSYPVPWASGAESSFVADAATYRRLLMAEGLEVLQQRDRRDCALEVFAQMRARGTAGGQGPLSLHIVMGASAAQKINNMIGDISSGLIAPTEMICAVAA